ncbi:hypothetical protein ACXYXE_000824 [Cronobacter dublinensis]|uniref:hypothetical protein n=1 Tax=Cronobacter dublinensis TaxID=413497 RepID=UPI0024AD173E|nr:hypothetical protein [Cronobacter dublinensis]MDI6445155.1 hypothetical protein [Cronobacter dublinensis]
MTLDVLLQLITALSRYTKQTDAVQNKFTCIDGLSGAHLQELIAILSSQKPHAHVLSGLIHRLHVLSAAHDDAAKAGALLAAHLVEKGKTLPVLDFTAWPEVRYQGSGELQTPESQAYFQTMTGAASILCAAIVQAEQTKGMSECCILDKVLHLKSALPQRYKQMANIHY